jgi:EmrB/QacA subfamily drug resistance transporter
MKRYTIYITIHLMILLSSISNSSVAVALPDIKSSFNTTLVLAGWVLSVYQLVAMCAMLIIGKVSDNFGRKRTFLLCSTSFILGSLLSSIAPNIQLLILFRFIQSAGAGGLVPVVTGVIAEVFPHSRQRAIGLSMSIYSFGGIIGPSIGAWLISSWGWRSIFWFNVPLGILVCIIVIYLLKADQGQRSHVDLKGAGLVVSSLFAIMIGLSQIDRHNTGVSWLIVGLLLILGLVLIFIFARHEMRSREPIIDLELLRLKPFVASNFYNFIFGICLFGITSFIPLYAVSVFGFSEIQSSLILSFRAVGMIVATVISSIFIIKWGYRKPMVVGSIIMSVVILLFGLSAQHSGFAGNGLSIVTYLCILGILFGLGNGIAMPASSNACIDLLPQKISTIMGTRGMFRQSGGAVSIAVISLVVQYIGNMALGFEIVFIALGILILATIPFVFSMPARANMSIETTHLGE